MSDSDIATVMEDEIIASMAKTLQELPQLRGNAEVISEKCVSTDILKTAGRHFAESAAPRTASVSHGLRGARLKHPHRANHPVYTSQSLFTLYVHTPPSFEGFPSDSIFYGREIEPAITGARFTHSLTEIALLLMEAALLDPGARNAHFVLLSEADVPLYHAGVLYLQLIMERRSRVGKSMSFQELMSNDQEAAALHPLIFVPPFNKDHFGKGSQWVALTRAATFVAVHDTIVEPWLATFGGSRWRCRFVEEGKDVMAALNNIQRLKFGIPQRWLATRLHRYGMMPRSYTEGGLLEGMMPSPEQIDLGTSWLWRTRANVGTLLDPSVEQDLYPSQKEAMAAYRAALRLTTPAWAFMRVLPQRTFQFPGVVAQGAATGSLTASRLSQARQRFLGMRGLRSSSEPPHVLRGRSFREAVVTERVRGAAGIEALRLRKPTAAAWAAAAWRGRAGARGVLRPAGPRALAAAAVTGAEVSVAAEAAAAARGQAGSVGARSEARERINRVAAGGAFLGSIDGGGGRSAVGDGGVPSRWTSDAARFAKEPASDEEARTKLAELIAGLPQYDNTSPDGAYGIPWPFEHGHVEVDMMQPVPWTNWTEGQQYRELSKLFTRPAARVMNIVSDETFLPILLKFYNMTGPAWQTDSFSHHVDWSRASSTGSPGLYTRDVIAMAPQVVKAVMRTTECNKLARDVYASAARALSLTASNAHALGVVNTTAFWPVWRHQPLPDWCTIFARKVTPDAGDVLPGLLEDCNAFGLDASCLLKAVSEAAHAA